MPLSLQNILESYVDELKKIYGNALKYVILFGSYARGDYKQDSDIDIMILAEGTDIDLKQYQSKLAAITFDYNLDHDLEINPVVVSINTFNKWVHVYPFYQNIDKEGVKLYAA